MILRKIVQRLERMEQDHEKVLKRLDVLERVEQNQKIAIMGRQERVERNQEAILGRLDALEKQAALSAAESKTGNTEKAPDEWMQDGIDNILNYQVGKKQEEQG